MLRQPALRSLPSAAARPLRQPLRAGRRGFLSRSQNASSRRQALETLNVRRLSEESQEYQRTRRNFLAAGAVAGVVSFTYTAWRLKQALSDPARLDSALSRTDPGAEGTRKVVIHDDEGREIVPTGNSTVPQFPRTISLPDYSPSGAAPSVPGEGAEAAAAAATLVVPPAAGPGTEYTLVGLGTRAVSFLGIQVYVVGFYVATADIAELQAWLAKKINPIASTLVSTEKDDLRQKLLDPAEGESIWQELLDSGVPARSAFRVVPVRDTDFHHLRDGLVRAIQARADPRGDERFGEAMRDFRQIFNRGKVPKRKELLLVRDKAGALHVMYDEGKTAGKQLLGSVHDERVTRALWLNYLAGKKVASEPARSSIVEGIIGFVERPVGTVAAQVI